MRHYCTLLTIQHFQYLLTMWDTLLTTLYYYFFNYSRWLAEMKSLILVVVVILSISLTTVTQVESACGNLRRGKRINKCKKEYLNKQRKLGMLPTKLVAREHDEKAVIDKWKTCWTASTSKTRVWKQNNTLLEWFLFFYVWFE